MKQIPENDLQSQLISFLDAILLDYEDEDWLSAIRKACETAAQASLPELPLSSRP